MTRNEKIAALIEHIRAEHPEAGNVARDLDRERDPLAYLRRVDAVFHGTAEHRWAGNQIEAG